MMHGESFEKRWRARFEGFAQHSDDDAGIAGWSRGGLEARMRNFARIWRTDRPGARWLDAGCGAGTYSRFIADRGIQVCGFDYSFPTIQKARMRAAPGIVWGVADVTRLPAKTGSFDGAVCFGVTQALADSAPALGELCRAVRPGGAIWIDALNRWCLPNLLDTWLRRLRGRPLHLRYESPRKLRELFQANGLVDVHLHWVPILPARLRHLQWLMEARATRWLIHVLPWLGTLVSHAFVLTGRRGGEKPQ
jgi:SAM-dependent methyltransferase